MQSGTTLLTLAETKLENSTGQPIDHAESSGSVAVYYGRYMRSDVYLTVCLVRISQVAYQGAGAP
jgi:predicted membrane-bound mannosyltransferase